MAGGLSDRISNRRAMARSGQRRKPEDRLVGLLPAIILLPLGIIIEGVCIQQKTHWIGVGMGIGIASFGLQIATTIVYTYTAEVCPLSPSPLSAPFLADPVPRKANHLDAMQCYRQQAAELGVLLNFARQMFGFCVGFYAVDLGEKVGFQDGWIALAMINVAVSIPVLALYFKGEEWRHAMGSPGFHQDL